MAAHILSGEALDNSLALPNLYAMIKNDKLDKPPAITRISSALTRLSNCSTPCAVKYEDKTYGTNTKNSKSNAETSHAKRTVASTVTLLQSNIGITFSLRGARTGGEAGCWSVPLEVIVRHYLRTPSSGSTMSIIFFKPSANFVFFSLPHSSGIAVSFASLLILLTVSSLIKLAVIL